MSTNALSVARYILERRQAAGDALTPMQLIKLVYIAQGHMLARYGRPLFNEQVEAWQYGPVVPSVYHAVKHFKSSPVIGINAWVQHFTPEEYEVMNHVADTYGPYNGVVLSAATHQPDTPWAQTWYAFGRNAPISNDIIENFYSKILQQPTHTSL